jgi:hypothetical protein
VEGFQIIGVEIKPNARSVVTHPFGPDAFPDSPFASAAASASASASASAAAAPASASASACSASAGAKSEPKVKVAFVMGNEGDGLNDKICALCDGFVYIPQHGFGTASLNVSVATAVVLQHFAAWAKYPEVLRCCAALLCCAALCCAVLCCAVLC